MAEMAQDEAMPAADADDAGQDAETDKRQAKKNKKRKKALRRLRHILEDWTELRATSSQGVQALVDTHEVEEYNMALNLLRQAGEKVPARYYAAGPVVPKAMTLAKESDGIPLHALLGKVRTVLSRYDHPPIGPDAV